MSYAGMGQAKWVPGQISFMTAPEGRLPNVQPLIEAGLPYAPYIEHGSWATGQPDIARYGRDPYRGLGRSLPPVDIEGAGDDIAEGIQTALQRAVTPGVMITLGATVGGLSGGVGGLLGKTVAGGLIGAVGGGVLGWLGYRLVAGRREQSLSNSNQGTSGLGGVLAVM